MKVHMVSVTRLMDSYLAEVAHGSLGVLCHFFWHKSPREPCATSDQYSSSRFACANASADRSKNFRWL